MSNISAIVASITIFGLLVALVLWFFKQLPQSPVDTIELEGVIDRIEKYEASGSTKYLLVLRDIKQIFVCEKLFTSVILARIGDEVKMVYIPHPELDEVTQLENLSLNARTFTQA